MLGANEITCHYGKTHFTEDVEVVGGVELKLQINAAVSHYWSHYSSYLCTRFQTDDQKSFATQINLLQGFNSPISVYEITELRRTLSLVDRYV